MCVSVKRITIMVEVQLSVCDVTYCAVCALIGIAFG